jgi:hypothetical protein
MVVALKHENRNTLAAKVVSGEVSFEKAITGLAQAEVRIFYRKLDKEFRAKHANSLQTQSFFMKRDETWTLLN